MKHFSKLGAPLPKRREEVGCEALSSIQVFRIRTSFLSDCVRTCQNILGLFLIQSEGERRAEELQNTFLRGKAPPMYAPALPPLEPLHPHRMCSAPPSFLQKTSTSGEVLWVPAHVLNQQHPDDRNIFSEI